MQIKPKQLKVTENKLVIGNSGGNGSELSYTIPSTIGTNGHVLTSNGTNVVFQAVSGGGGGSSISFSRKSASFSAAVNYHYSITTASGAVTVTLPALSGASNGDTIRIFFRARGSTNNVVVNRATSTSDLINDETSFTLDVEHDSITLIANTTDSIWELI